MVSQGLFCAFLCGWFLFILSQLMDLEYSFVCLPRIQLNIIKSPPSSILLSFQGTPTPIQMNTQISRELQEKDLLLDPETLSQLREQLMSLLEHERNALELLNCEFQADFHSVSEAAEHLGAEGTIFSEKVMEYLRNLECCVQQKSENVSSLAQFGLKMIESAFEAHYQHQQLRERYQTEIDTLNQQNGCLTLKNATIENDVEYFREHLEVAQTELDQIVNQPTGPESGSQEETYAEFLYLKDRQIEALQRELYKINQQIQAYKVTLHEQSTKQQEHRYMRIRSLNSLLPSEKADDTQLLNSQKRIQELESENCRLQQEIEERKLRARRKTKIEEIKEQIGEETDRDPPIKQDSPDPNPALNTLSTSSLLQRVNLQGDIKESLNSSPLCHIDSSNNLSKSFNSSSKSLFHFQLHDLRDMESQNSFDIQANNPLKHMRSLDLSSNIIKEVIGPLKKVVEPKKILANLGVNTESKKRASKGTSTADPSKEQASLMKRLILKPIVSILMRLIWSNGSAVACIG